MTKRVTAIFSASTVTLAGLLLIPMPIAVIASTDCSYLNGCEKKFCEMERQLEIARKKDNERKADGLKKALEEAKENCTDKSLREDLSKEMEEVKEEIAEYESDLEEAKEYGKRDKVHKYQEKIEEEKKKIKHLENELSDLD